MSLDRKDIRAKLDPELHAALCAICRVDGIEISEYVERVLAPVIRRDADRAIVLSRELLDQGFSGTSRE